MAANCAFGVKSDVYDAVFIDVFLDLCLQNTFAILLSVNKLSMGVMHGFFECVSCWAEGSDHCLYGQCCCR